MPCADRAQNARLRAHTSQHLLERARARTHTRWHRLDPTIHMRPLRPAPALPAELTPELAAALRSVDPTFVQLYGPVLARQQLSAKQLRVLTRDDFHAIGVPLGHAMRLSETFAGSSEEGPGDLAHAGDAYGEYAVVSALVFGGKCSKYFAVGKITDEQVQDYAARKKMDVKEVERWLATSLNYEP